jgi:choline dehydrogenase-like flavoprotein
MAQSTWAILAIFSINSRSGCLLSTISTSVKIRTPTEAPLVDRDFRCLLSTLVSALALSVSTHTRAANYTRSYSKTGYLIDRPNFTVLIGQTTTKITFDISSSSAVKATGVMFQADASSPTYTVRANKEVILSSGVIGSPHLLQVSGIGSSSLLSSIGVDTIVDLPGVGEHLNDHLSGGLAFETSAEVTGDLIKSNDTFAAQQMALWKRGRADSLYSSPNSKPSPCPSS